MSTVVCSALINLRVKHISHHVTIFQLILHQHVFVAVNQLEPTRTVLNVIKNQKWQIEQRKIASALKALV